MILLEPIGTVETPFQSLSEAPSQGFLEEHSGTITLRSRLAHAVEGLSVPKPDTNIVLVDTSGADVTAAAGLPVAVQHVVLSHSHRTAVPGSTHTAGGLKPKAPPFASVPTWTVTSSCPVLSATSE